MWNYFLRMHRCQSVLNPKVSAENANLCKHSLRIASSPKTVQNHSCWHAGLAKSGFVGNFAAVESCAHFCIGRIMFVGDAGAENIGKMNRLLKLRLFILVFSSDTKFKIS